MAKLDTCLERLREPEFAEHIWTDRLPIPAVAERIAGHCGLSLAPNTAGPVRQRLHCAWTGIQHIRLR